MKNFNKICESVGEDFLGDKEGNLCFVFKTFSEEELKQLKRLLKENLDLFPSSNFRDNIEFKQKDSELWVIRTDKTFNKETDTKQLFENEFLFGVWMNFIVNKLRIRRYVKDFSEFQGNKSERLKSFKTVIKDMKFEKLKQKLPELEGLLESDKEKGPQDYTLDEFTSEEERIFKTFAEAVVKNAEQNKQRLLHSLKATKAPHGLTISSIDNDKLIHLKRELMFKQPNSSSPHFDEVFAFGWSAFYLQCMITLSPSLWYRDGEFELQFSKTYSKIVPESKGWEEYIIKSFKRELEDAFYNYFLTGGLFAGKAEQFFEWREEKLKYKKLAKKLPELEGLLESRFSDQTDGVLILSFSNLSEEVKEVLLKVLKTKQNKYARTTEIKDKGSDVEFVMKDISYELWNNAVKHSKSHTMNNFENDLYTNLCDTYPNLKADEVDEWMERFFKNADLKVKERKLYDLQQKLPELEGLLESRSGDEDGIVVLRFFNLSKEDKKHLVDLIKLQQKKHKNYTEVKQHGDSVEFIMKDMSYDHWKTLLEKFEKPSRLFYNHFILNVPDYLDIENAQEFLERVFENSEAKLYDKKLYDLQQKLPELEGLLENVSTEEVVDVIIPLKEPLKGKALDYIELAEELADYIQDHTAVNIKSSWDFKKEPRYICDIKLNPFRIVILNVPKNVLKVYLIELKEVLFHSVVQELSYESFYKKFAHIINISMYRNVDIDEESPKFRRLQNKLPELEGLLENLPNDVTFQNYGYHLKTFTKQEEDFFEKLADEIVKNAEKTKIKVLDDPRFGVKMKGIDIFESLFEPLKKQIANDLKSNDNLWQWFYTNMVSNLFPIYLYQVPNEDEFYLDFITSNMEPDFSLKEVRESQGWKEEIIKRLKSSLSTEFIGHLNAISTQSTSFRTKEFFEWREEKLKYQNLQKKLPELEGLLEGSSKHKRYGLIPSIDLKEFDDFQELWIVYKLDDQKDPKEFVTKFLSIPQQKLDEYGLSLKKLNEPFTFAVISTGHPELLQNLKKHVMVSEFGDSLANQVKVLMSPYFTGTKHVLWHNVYLQGLKTKWTELQKKLPELEGLLEDVNDDKWKYTATFDSVYGSDIHNKLKKSLENTKDHLKLYYKIDSEIELNDDKQFVFKTKNSGIWDFDEENQRNTFIRVFDNNITSYVRFVGTFKHKFEDLQKKLPELEGLLESKGNSEWEFFATFEPTTQDSKLHGILNSLKIIQQSNGKNDIEIKMKEDGSWVYHLKSSDNWDFDDEEERNRFLNSFHMALNALKTLRDFEGKIKFVAKFKNKKLEDLQKKLPELEGLLERTSKFTQIIQKRLNSSESSLLH